MNYTKNADILSVKEVSEILRIGINNAYELVRSGQIHSVRIGRQYRIPVATLEAYLAVDN